MKAVVGVRPSPHRLIDEGGTARPYRWHASIVDRVALEAALRTAETVVAVGIGGKPAKECVRTALTTGADRGIHVSFDPIEETVAEKYAAVLARVAAREDPDVLYVGEFSPLMDVEVAGLAAETLDWPSTTRITAIGADEVLADDEFGANEVAVQRKLDVGRQEVLGVELPAVLGIDSGFANPRRASLETAVSGRRAEIETIPLEDVVPGESRFSMSVGAATIERVVPNERWGRGEPPRGGTVEERIYRMLGRGTAEGQTTGEVVDAPPEEAAERVVEYLRENNLL
ncbi:Electron transfer flavoprotein alpha/beta- subunit (plasmid) [Haloterrigena turkmenica DSM 5511]|uniref:Electron transfer flavoprotein alpha/beta-subunit n=1 Tax=Haloterrigena turkmenica (strain ATCC 51198 / DSM 5511 / JCM 9101 / NCIMB 13204 / VKM B-1734 / 4k) TaxID=543526 RepID=D2S024_HALTV|nr:electron transfer flavoprotein alpha/beta- subunit [Haloterrigena turkmenica]ADB62721.1 Electron transfer flavoprotein alpha/beta- subunit [Haloterrigena turkmenica DSM 5511]